MKKSGLLHKAEKINNKANCFSILAIIFGFVFIAYDVTLICLCPGTLLDNIISFSHIWSALGIYHIFAGIYRLKTRHSVWQSWKKWFKLTFVSIAFIITVISGVSLYYILTPELADMNESVDYVIVLGGGISKDGKLPVSVEKRIEKAAEYMNLHKDSIGVVTGGTLHFLPVAEAPELKRFLVENGIEESRVLVEDQALDTIQNFQYSCKMLSEHTGRSYSEILNSSIGVVSSHFHLRRAERLAKRMGFTNIKGIPSKIPAINIVHTYVREICAYLKLNLRILLTGEPSPITE